MDLCFLCKVIWSALIASAAVPGILNPVVLMQKDKTGRLIPWNWGTRFRDGSLRYEYSNFLITAQPRLESTSLFNHSISFSMVRGFSRGFDLQLIGNTLLTVNNPIVSQVNPHVSRRALFPAFGAGGLLHFRFIYGDTHTLIYDSLINI